VPQKYGLGSGNGRIIEYEDGTAGYIQSMSFTQAFRVKITDVTGFSVEKSGKLLTRKFNVLGNGTLLGTAEVNHGTAEVIENWFRSHPLFGSSASSTPASGASPSVADEIAKLGQLRSQGLITESEFEAQKARLLS
jgi:hypothetical protein